MRIHGFIYRVLTVDTSRAWLLIRVRASSLVPPSDPASVFSLEKRAVEHLALNSLAQFEARGNRPKYYKPGQYRPTQAQIHRAAKWHVSPQSAVEFFKQMGRALQLNPLPDAATGLTGTPLRALPSWVVPQAGALDPQSKAKLYHVPAYPQTHTLARFKSIGLTANGFKLPSNWGPAQIAALQTGVQNGENQIANAVASGNATRATNYWFDISSGIGDYRNTPQGYINRALVTIGGGAANIPQDAVYAQVDNLGHAQAPLDGNNTYTLTFRPPVTHPAGVPVVGTLPPTANDSQGNPLGFWSVTLYQPDKNVSDAPFLPPTSVLNTAYSTANIAVTAVDAARDEITVKPPPWVPLEKSTPIMFGSTAAKYGLQSGVPYCVATSPEPTDPQSKNTTYSFTVATGWQQPLADNVPTQGDTGTPEGIVSLINPGGTVDLQWGPVQPVSQLGSQQLTSGRLHKNVDRSVTIWLAPTLPPNAYATNWIPTPSTSYFNNNLYPPGVSTTVMAMIRTYYPAAASNTQASILPPPNGSMQATYVFPELKEVS